MAKAKGMGIKTSVKSGNFRPTKSGAGMTKKGVAAYRKANPGSKLQTAVTEDNPSGARAKRRKSYCARSAGQMKKFPEAAKDPNSRIRQARKRWKQLCHELADCLGCGCIIQHGLCVQCHKAQKRYRAIQIPLR